MELHERCDMATEILRATHDGDDLSPQHLKLLEMVVNDHANEKGEQAFRSLHKQVMAGEYTRPFLHDVEHMTQDREGYIYFKGIHVEHFSRDWAHTEGGKAELVALQKWCLEREKLSEPINAAAAMFRGIDNDKPRQQNGAQAKEKKEVDRGR